MRIVDDAKTAQAGLPVPPGGHDILAESWPHANHLIERRFRLICFHGMHRKQDGSKPLAGESAAGTQAVARLTGLVAPVFHQ